jgi:hypothetical protein
MNLAGLYHSLDTMMTVVSLDTLETIDFTLANLAIHTATARAYAYGTRYFNELLSQYPTQLSLILGVLYPVDITTAINAVDGTILGYPSDLVESNEYSLISNLQKWVTAYRTRWTNTQYNISDNLNMVSNLGLQYIFLVPAIINLRKAACKTNEAHSFHVGQYLASRNFSDDILDALTLDQSLFFYKNIDYITRHSGMTSTFNWLVENVMTARNLPLARYVMKHDTSVMPAALKPGIVFEYEALNTAYSSNTAKTITLDTLLTKEDESAPQNATVQAYVESDITKAMQYSLSNRLPTKVLESAMIDTSDSTPYTMADILLYYWAYMGMNGLYSAIVDVTNPSTGESIPLSMSDAFVFAQYAYWQAYGVTLDIVQPVYTQRIQRHPLPSASDLMSMAKAGMVDNSVATYLLGLMPAMSKQISITAFYSFCKSVYTAMNTQRKYVAYQEHKDVRGYVDNMVTRLYQDAVCEPDGVGLTYTRWFAERDIVISDFANTDMATLYQTILADATGSSLNTAVSLADIQAAMVKLMRQLSSYSVQFIATINTVKIKSGDWACFRVGNQAGQLKNTIVADNLGVRAIGTSAEFKDSITYDVGNYNTATVKGSWKENTKIDVGSLISLGKRAIRQTVRLNTRFTGIISKNTLPSHTRGEVEVFGSDIYNSLTSAQRYTVPDVYGNEIYLRVEEHETSDLIFGGDITPVVVTGGGSTGVVTNVQQNIQVDPE